MSASTYVLLLLPWIGIVAAAVVCYQNNWFFIITFPVRKLYVNMGQPLITHVNVIHDQNLLKEKSILPEPTRRWILQHKQLGIQNYRLDSLNQNWQQQLGNGW